MDAEELLRRYAAGERDFQGIELDGGDTVHWWQQWENPYIDTSSNKLHGAILRDIKLNHAKIQYVTLTNSDLTGADISNATIIHSNLSGSKLDNTKLSNSKISSCILFGSDLSNSDLSDADFIFSKYDSNTQWPDKPKPSSWFLMGPNANLRGRIFTTGSPCLVDLTGSNLSETEFRPQNIKGSNLSYCTFNNAAVSSCGVQGSGFERVNFTGADFSQAKSFENINLSETNLHNTKPPRQCINCKISYTTYLNSQWTIEDLKDWSRTGIQIETETFPVEIIQKLYSSGINNKGLTLYLNTPLNRVERFLADGLIVGTLGQDTDCEVVEYRCTGEGSILRLEASDTEDLQRVAQVLYDRVWEEQTNALEIQLHNTLTQNLLGNLSNLRNNKASHAELRVDTDSKPQTIIFNQHIYKTITLGDNSMYIEGDIKNNKDSAIGPRTTKRED